LSDPDHLTNFKVSDLYVHWLGRQQRKLPPFVVLNPGPHHRAAEVKLTKAEGKRKMEYVEDNSDDEVKSSGGEGEEEDQSGAAAEFGEVIFPPTRFGPPMGNIAGSSKVASKKQDGVPVAGTSSIPLRKHSINKQQEKEAERGVAFRKVSLLDEAEQIQEESAQILKERAKARTSPKTAKSQKLQKPTVAGSLKTHREGKTARRASEVAVEEPTLVGNHN
jgi:hypothetical protein